MTPRHEYVEELRQDGRDQRMLRAEQDARWGAPDNGPPVCAACGRLSFSLIRCTKCGAEIR